MRSGAGPPTAIVAIAVVHAPLFFRVVRGSVLAESALSYPGVGGLRDAFDREAR